MRACMRVRPLCMRACVVGMCARVRALGEGEPVVKGGECGECGGRGLFVILGVQCTCLLCLVCACVCVYVWCVCTIYIIGHCVAPVCIWMQVTLNGPKDQYSAIYKTNRPYYHYHYVPIIDQMHQ